MSEREKVIRNACGAATIRDLLDWQLFEPPAAGVPPTPDAPSVVLCQPTQIAYSSINMAEAPMTVVETEEFLRKAKPLMSDAEREDLGAYLGANPQAGKIVAKTGGVRKVRWGLAGRGKRCGARVIYYYHSERLPLFLLTAYPKNEKANLTQAERNAMKRLVQILVAGYPGKK